MKGAKTEIIIDNSLMIKRKASFSNEIVNKRMPLCQEKVADTTDEKADVTTGKSCGFFVCAAGKFHFLQNTNKRVYTGRGEGYADDSGTYGGTGISDFVAGRCEKPRGEAPGRD
jgi:hypothetical protein